MPAALKLRHNASLQIDWQSGTETINTGEELWHIRRLGPLQPGAGEKLPVILLHGFGGCLYDWCLLHADLASDRAVIAVDLPGHGESPSLKRRPSLHSLSHALIHLQRALAIPKAHYVTHCFSAALVLHLIADHPEFCASLFALSAYGFGQAANTHYLQGVMQARQPGDLRPFIEMSYNDRTLVTDEALNIILEYTQRHAQSLQDAANAFFGAEPINLCPDIAGTAVPICAVWGQQDQIISPPRFAPAPEVETILVPNAGQMLHQEHPREVLALAQKFLADKP